MMAPSNMFGMAGGASYGSKPTRARVGRRRCRRHAPGVQSRVFVLHVTGS